MNSWHHLPDLYFLHIPKTAGTSLRVWAEQLFPADAILPAFHLHAMEELPDETIRASRFASGHFGWRFVERAGALGRPPAVFTFLRETLAMRMSTLSYAASVPEEELEKQPPEVARRMREAATMMTSDRMVDFVTRQEINIEAQLALQTPDRRARHNPYLLFLAGPGSQLDDVPEITPQRMELARQRLRDMLSVGVVEDMAGSMALLCDRLGLPFLPMGMRLNTSSDKLQPSPSFTEYVTRLSGPNIELHQLATRLVAERHGELLARYGLPADAPPDALAAPMRNAFLTTDRGLARIARAAISMGDGLVSEGLAPRIATKPGRWQRWAGRRATLYLPLDPRRDRSIHFAVPEVMSDKIHEGIGLTVNGQDIALKPTGNRFWQKTLGATPGYQGTIPARAMDPDAQYTALDFHAPEDLPNDHPEVMGERASFALGDVIIR